MGLSEVSVWLTARWTQVKLMRPSSTTRGRHFPDDAEEISNVFFKKLLGVVFLFPTDTFASRFEITPQMKELCCVWGSEASIHHFTRTQVQCKCLPLSGAQKCHAVPLPLLFPGDLIEKVKFLLGQTICSCRV